MLTQRKRESRDNLHCTSQLLLSFFYCASAICHLLACLLLSYSFLCLSLTPILLLISFLTHEHYTLTLVIERTYILSS